MSDFTLKNLEEVEDQAAKHGLGPALQARFAHGDLDSTGTGLSLQRLAPNERAPFAHHHNEVEEVYVVLAGSGRPAYRPVGRPRRGGRPGGHRVPRLRPAPRQRRGDAAGAVARLTPGRVRPRRGGIDGPDLVLDELLASAKALDRDGRAHRAESEHRQRGGYVEALGRTSASLWKGDSPRTQPGASTIAPDGAYPRSPESTGSISGSAATAARRLARKTASRLRFRGSGAGGLPPRPAPLEGRGGSRR
jgi:hypothetical protein